MPLPSPDRADRAAVTGLDHRRRGLQVADLDDRPSERAIGLGADEVHEVGRAVGELHALRWGERSASGRRRDRHLVVAGADELAGLALRGDIGERRLVVEEHGHVAGRGGVADDDAGLPGGHGREVVDVGAQRRVAGGVEVGDQGAQEAGRHGDGLGQQRRVGRRRAGGTDVDDVVAGRDGQRIRAPLGLERREDERSVEVDVGHQSTQAMDHPDRSDLLVGSVLGVGRCGDADDRDRDPRRDQPRPELPYAR